MMTLNFNLIHKYLPGTTAAEIAPLGHSSSPDPTSWGPKPSKSHAGTGSNACSSSSWTPVTLTKSVDILWKVHSLGGNSVKKKIKFVGKYNSHASSKQQLVETITESYTGQNAELTTGSPSPGDISTAQTLHLRLRKHCGGVGKMVRAISYHRDQGVFGTHEI